MLLLSPIFLKSAVSLDKLDEAEEWGRKSLEIKWDLMHPNRGILNTSIDKLADYAAGLATLGRILEYKGNKDEAIKQYLEGLRILKLFEDAIGKPHYHRPDILDVLGMIFQAEERYEEAEERYKEALEIRLSNLPVDHPDLAKSYHNLACILTTQGKYNEAEKLFLDALEIKENRLSENHHSLQLSRDFLRGLIQQTLANGRTTELSDHPLTQQLLQELRNN